MVAWKTPRLESRADAIVMSRGLSRAAAFTVEPEAIPDAGSATWAAQ